MLNTSPAPSSANSSSGPLIFVRSMKLETREDKSKWVTQTVRTSVCYEGETLFVLAKLYSSCWRIVASKWSPQKWDQRSEWDPFWDSPSYIGNSLWEWVGPLFGIPRLIQKLLFGGSSLPEQKERLGLVYVVTLVRSDSGGCVSYPLAIVSDTCKSTKKSLWRTRRLEKISRLISVYQWSRSPPKVGPAGRKGGPCVWKHRRGHPNCIAP